MYHRYRNIVSRSSHFLIRHCDELLRVSFLNKSNSFRKAWVFKKLDSFRVELVGLGKILVLVELVGLSEIIELQTQKLLVREFSRQPQHIS